MTLYEKDLACMNELRRSARILTDNSVGAAAFEVRNAY